MTVHFYRDIIYVKWNNKLEVGKYN